MLTEKDARELMMLRAEAKAIDERIKELTAAAQDMAEDTYALGDFKVVTTVTRRFDPRIAEAVLSAEERDALYDVVLSPSLAKQNLPPARYAECMKEYGVQVKVTQPGEDA